MKNSAIRNFFLIAPKKVFAIKMGILFISGISFLFINHFHIRFFPIINLLGICLFVLGLLFHLYCEKIHKQAHESSDNISHIVTTSVYSKIRHPLYISLIFMTTGIGLAFGDLVTILLSLVYSAFTVITALYEEEYLSRKFPEYVEYKRRVPWRMIPYVF